MLVSHNKAEGRRVTPTLSTDSANSDALNLDPQLAPTFVIIVEILKIIIT